MAILCIFPTTIGGARLTVHHLELITEKLGDKLLYNLQTTFVLRLCLFCIIVSALPRIIQNDVLPSYLPEYQLEEHSEQLTS